MVVLTVKFETSLTEDELVAIAKERLPAFQALPGLIQKYYVKHPEPNHYGGVYIWDSEASMQEYRKSDLAASIPSAYKVIGAPEVKVMEGLFPLRG